MEEESSSDESDEEPSRPSKPAPPPPMMNKPPPPLTQPPLPPAPDKVIVKKGYDPKQGKLNGSAQRVEARQFFTTDFLISFLEIFLKP